MKKYMTAVLILTLTLSACASSPKPVETSSSTSAVTEAETTQAVTEAPTETPTEAPTEATLSAEETPIDYTWDPQRYSGFLAEMLGEETEEMYRGLVAAVLNREETFRCSGAFRDVIYSAIKPCMPVFERIAVVGDRIEASEDENGTFEYSLEYQVTPEEQTAILEEFGERVETLIIDAVRVSDNETQTAIALYKRFCEDLVYDYDAAMDITDVDVSPYRAIMTGEGICQSFSAAYSHLCIQCGIPAGETGGMTENYDAHEWTILKLGDVYYYADPTWQEGTSGLNYFGFTSQYREEVDGYPEEWQNVGDLNLFMADEMPVGDDRFEELLMCVNSVEISRENGVMKITALDDAWEEVMVEIP